MDFAAASSVAATLHECCRRSSACSLVFGMAALFISGVLKVDWPYLLLGLHDADGDGALQGRRGAAHQRRLRRWLQFFRHGQPDFHGLAGPGIPQLELCYEARQVLVHLRSRRKGDVSANMVL